VIDLLSRERDEALRQRLAAPRALHVPHHLDVEIASAIRGSRRERRSPTTGA